MVQNRILRVILFREMVWNRTPRVTYSLAINGSEWNSEGFSLPRNDSERNSEGFLFRKTSGIPTELPSVPSCSVFRGNFFLLENGNIKTDTPGKFQGWFSVYTQTRIQRMARVHHVLRINTAPGTSTKFTQFFSRVFGTGANRREKGKVERGRGKGKGRERG
jgi:hypothetical protein